jgi:hypothetical protein
MKGALAILVVLFTLYNVGLTLALNKQIDEAYSQGRKDKNAEIMEFIAGNKKARLAIVTPKTITYHSEGTCAICHSS